MIASLDNKPIPLKSRMPAFPTTQQDMKMLCSGWLSLYHKTRSGMPSVSQKIPEFSIITICLNEAHGMEQTCESIIQQKYSNYEWIVVDGASTDSTLDILDRYHERITTLVTEADDGIYDAMNKGIELSRGKYLVFMNGGDRFSSSEVLDWVAQAPQADLIYGQLELNEPGGELLSPPEKIRCDYLIKHMIHHQAAFFHRSLFGCFGLYDTSYRIAADYEFFSRILLKGEISHHYIAKPIAIFDYGGISRNQNYRQLRKRENHRIRAKYFPSYRWSAKAWRQRIRNLIIPGKSPR